MTSQDAAQPAAGAGGNAGMADALRAAVRAVESGERPADSFFPRPPEPPARGAGGSGGAARGPALPVAVPEGLAALLAEGGAPPGLAAAVAAVLGEGAGQELRADPWRLLAAGGAAPEQADEFARALLGPECSPGDARRSRALTVWLLERAARDAGHTALEPAAVLRGLARWGVPDPEGALREAVDAGAVLVCHDPVEAGSPAGPAGQDVDEGPGEGPGGGPGGGAGEDDGEEPPGAARPVLGLHACVMAEESLADGLLRLRATLGQSRSPEPGASDWERAAAAAGPASDLVRAVAGAALVTHTGGETARAEPAALVAAARALGLRAYAAAHAADGRRRLAAALPEADREAAVTVAGLLDGQEGPGRDAAGMLSLDLLAVLDAPQLDVETAAWLVESLPDGARLVLSGDPLLLGAAGPGQVLADVLAADVCPRVTSAAGGAGPLGELLAGVAAGELRAVPAPGKEVVIVPVGDPGEAVHRAVQLVADSIPRAFGEHARGGQGIQVIALGHGGAAGTRALNAALKDRLNPGPGRFGGFDVGDRAVHCPAPGRARTAAVTAADAEGLWLQDGAERWRVAREQVADSVRHGWAVTAHQAAGSRWPAAVVVLPGDAGPVLDRSWVYTAFGRAAHHLSVVQGAGPALARAVGAPPATARTTRLRALLREQSLVEAAGETAPA